MGGRHKGGYGHQGDDNLEAYTVIGCVALGLLFIIVMAILDLAGVISISGARP